MNKIFRVAFLGIALLGVNAQAHHHKHHQEQARKATDIVLDYIGDREGMNSIGFFRQMTFAPRGEAYTADQLRDQLAAYPELKDILEVYDVAFTNLILSESDFLSDFQSSGYSHQGELLEVKILWDAIKENEKDYSRVRRDLFKAAMKLDHHLAKKSQTYLVLVDSVDLEDPVESKTSDQESKESYQDRVEPVQESAE